MIALEKDRAGLIDVVVELATSGFGAFDVVVDFDAIENDSDFVSDHGRFGGLPLVAGLGDEFVRFFEVVESSVSAQRGFAFGIVAEDLNFVTATQVKAAVGIVGDEVFEFDGEV